MSDFKWLDTLFGFFASDLTQKHPGRAQLSSSPLVPWDHGTSKAMFNAVYGNVPEVSSDRVTKGWVLDQAFCLRLWARAVDLARSVNNRFCSHLDKQAQNTLWGQERSLWSRDTPSSQWLSSWSTPFWPHCHMSGSLVTHLSPGLLQETNCWPLLFIRITPLCHFILDRWCLLPKRETLSVPNCSWFSLPKE